VSNFSNKLHAVLSISLSACLFAALARAQSDSAGWIGAPIFGLIANAEQTEIRAIQGVPGASTVGIPIALPAGVRQVYLAPLQQWALVQQLREGALGRLPLNGNQFGSVVPIHGAMSTPELVSFSSNGRNAALVSLGGVLQILTHLEETPQIAMQTDISELDATVVTVSNDGTLSVVLTRTGEVYLVPSSGSPRLICRTGSPAGLSFLPDQALVIADGAAGTVTVIDGLMSQPFTRATISGPYLSGDAAFVQASSDGKSVILSAYKGQTAYRIDLVDQSASSLNLPAGVSMLERLNGNIFVFSANPGEAAWFLMADNANLRAGFAQFAGASVVRSSPPRRGLEPAREVP